MMSCVRHSMLNVCCLFSKQIVPTKCTNKVTLKLMEIRLYKKEPVEWDYLIPPSENAGESHHRSMFSQQSGSSRH